MSSMIDYIKWGLLGGLLLINIFIWQAVSAEERGGLLTIAFLDVGQGDAIFIEAPNGNQMLIDGGASRAVLRELGRVLPVHDRSIDIVLATHPDADHIGGLPHVIDAFEVSNIIRSGAVNDTAVFRALNTAAENEKDAQVLLARRGTRIHLGSGVYFDILFPDRDVSRSDPNNASVIGQLVYGETRIMLTGDAPKSIEEYLVSLDGKKLESDVLKVGHHGSKTSSSQNFLGFVSPEYSIISAGCGNRYGHPHQGVLDKLNQFNIEVLGTCEEGTIVFESDGNLLLKR